MENPTRRRVLAAGLAGTTLGLLGGRAVSAGTTPPADEPSATDPPARPTAADIELLAFAETVELTARDLYQASIEAGADDPLIGLMRDNHQAYADGLSGILGVDGSGRPDDALFEELLSSFEVSDIAELAANASDLESTMVATHTELLRALEGIDGAQMIAAILVVEARAATVLADLAGLGDDLDSLFVNDVEPLAVGQSARG